MIGRLHRRVRRSAAVAALSATLTGALVAGLAGQALAADRPFLATTGAAAEEDDDGVWSVETVLQSNRAVRAASVAIEYAFDPRRSLQLELGRTRDRLAGESGQFAELEFKYLFNHIARDGWGWGLNLGLGADKANGQGWRGGSWALTMPLSVELGQRVATAHLNLGLVRERGERRHSHLSLGIEGEVARRVTLFAEVVRSGDERLAHVGVRHWLKKEKLALDIAATRQSGEGGGRVSGWVLGLGWYDL